MLVSCGFCCVVLLFYYCTYAVAVAAWLFGCSGRGRSRCCSRSLRIASGSCLGIHKRAGPSGPTLNPDHCRFYRRDWNRSVPMIAHCWSLFICICSCVCVWFLWTSLCLGTSVPPYLCSDLLALDRTYHVRPRGTSRRSASGRVGEKHGGGNTAQAPCHGGCCHAR